MSIDGNLRFNGPPGSRGDPLRVDVIFIVSDLDRDGIAAKCRIQSRLS
jgi:hypothetical protein